MDWLYSGRLDTFRYVLVDKNTKEEVKELQMFMNGGTIEYNDLTSLKVAGSLPYFVPPDIGFNYLRVYSESFLEDGQSAEILHGTFLVATPASEIRYQMRSGSASIYSLLKIVQDASIDEPLSIPEGTNAIEYAVSSLRDLDFEVIADQSETELRTAANFEAGTSWLEIINYLCEVAGFNSANVDGIGNIILTAYSDPSARQPSVELIDDERCIYNPNIKYEFDIFEIPNKVVVTMSNEEESMTAIARNNDPLSIYSIPSRGREITYAETVSDIANMKALQDLAERRLAEKSSAVESIEFQHNFIPYNTGEVGRFVYNQASFDFLGTAVKKQIKLVPGMPCNVRFRRFIRMTNDEGFPFAGIGKVFSTAAMTIYSNYNLSGSIGEIPANVKAILEDVFIVNATTTNGTGVRFLVNYFGVRGYIQNTTATKTEIYTGTKMTSSGTVTMYSDGATTPSGNVTGTPIIWTSFGELENYYKVRLDTSGTTANGYRYGYVLKTVLTPV